jgi:diguanylate cyclase (GGDEF)-like protein
MLVKPKKLSILIVDDEKSNIDVLNHILKDKYKIYIAKNGENAIRIARDSQPDLILLDIVMPDKNGYEVLVELKESNLTQNIPVIFITGQDSKEAEVKGLSLGAVDYITKPFHNIIVEARVCTQMKLVEQMRTIERMSITDALTDLPNRRYFNDQIAKEWGRAIREITAISLLIIDVDNFKIYNDTHGHPQGDTLLQAVSDIFKNELKRPADTVARWGGEEFILLMPNTDQNGAMEVAERIRAAVEAESVPNDENGTPTSVTVSIGVNSEKPTLNMSLANFVSKADKALYAAKNNGRNKVFAYAKGM